MNGFPLSDYVQDELLNGPPAFFTEPSEAERLFHHSIPDHDQQEKALLRAESDQETYAIMAYGYDEGDLNRITEQADNGTLEQVYNVPSLYELALIRYYTQSGFIINADLNAKQVDPDVQAFAVELGRILSSFEGVFQEQCLEDTPDDLTLFRGAEEQDLPKDRLAVGQTLDYPHLFSTTPNLETATRFASCAEGPCGQGYIYVLHNSNGINISEFSVYHAEEEYLFPSHALWQVDHIEEKMVDVDDRPGADPKPMTFVHISPAKP